MAHDPDLQTLETMRAELLAAALDLAPFEGWTGTMLRQAERASGQPAGAADLSCPRGPLDLIDYWALTCDEAMQARLAATALGEMKVRERVAAGVRARLEAIGAERREAARRAMARLALPDAAARGVRIGWRAADRIWRAIGDVSTDGAFYSKRAILSGVLANVTTVWLNDDADRAWATLDRRIENVMSFERTKVSARRMAEGWPRPLDLISSLRYPRPRPSATVPRPGSSRPT